VNSPAWQRRHRPGDERLRGFKRRIRGARRPTPEWFDEEQSLILAAQIVSSKRVRFCALVVEKMRNQETAPIASGWSVRRVGLSPTGKRRLLTARAQREKPSDFNH
jgi:hypothetical protein